MESLDNKWILSSEEADATCSEKDSNSPATLGLENMRGVFILVRGVSSFSIHIIGTAELKPPFITQSIIHIIEQLS